MKISNHTHVLEGRFGALGAVRMNCDAGFEAIDYSMYNAERSVFGKGGSVLTKEMRRIAEAHGVVFNQAHAPFSKFKIGAENDAHNRTVFSAICRSLEVAGELGAPIIVVHPAVICPRLSADDRFDMNMEFYSKLLPRAKSLGLKIAIENMWGRHKDKRERIIKDVCSDAAELIRYVDGMNDESVIACLDVGHAGLVGEAADEMALALGHRLGSLHIHDNDFFSDTHTLPYFGNMNFTSLIKALSRIGYSGDITLEADCFYSELPSELIPAALAFSREVAKHIRNQIESLKTTQATE